LKKKVTGAGKRNLSNTRRAREEERKVTKDRRGGEKRGQGGESSWP